MENLERKLIKEHFKFIGKLLLTGGIAMLSYDFAQKDIIPEAIGYLGYGLGLTGMVISSYQTKNNARKIKSKYRTELIEE